MERIKHPIARKEYARRIRFKQQMNELRFMRIDAIKNAKEEAKLSGFPVLTGTRKQRGWAFLIRQRFSFQESDALEKLFKSGTLKENEAGEFGNWLFSHAESHFWIEQRDTSWEELFKMFKQIRSIRKTLW